MSVVFPVKSATRMGTVSTSASGSELGSSVQHSSEFARGLSMKSSGTSLMDTVLASESSLCLFLRGSELRKSVRWKRKVMCRLIASVYLEKCHYLNNAYKLPFLFT